MHSEKVRRNHIDIITMGCSKNLVDSEVLMRRLEELGYSCTHDSKAPRGEIVVVNTCGFIADAKQESINAILELAEAKKRGRIGRLYVMGCLCERYMGELAVEIPEVDRYYGKFDFRALLEDLGKASPGTTADKGRATPGSLAGRHLTTPRHYAYVKISEGCDRHCAYCAIPLMTGRHRSRPMGEILREVRALAASGTREFQVIAQELTYYGIDTHGKRLIAELVDRMADIPGVKWIRLHYAYPTDFPLGLLKVMRERPNVCKYLDMALQHVSDGVLAAMRRGMSGNQTRDLVSRIREEVPGIHLRTTLMVGFPGEGEREFSELLDFTRWARFERMGAFAYSEEDGTFSARHLPDTIPEDVKCRRLDRLMALQQDISSEIAQGKVGKTFEVVVDRREGGYHVCRTEFSSPEVDPEVLVPIGPRSLRTGSFHQVRITGAEEFDLYGEVTR